MNAKQTAALATIAATGPQGCNSLTGHGRDKATFAALEKAGLIVSRPVREDGKGEWRWFLAVAK